MISLSIEYDDQSVQLFLTDIEREQIPFATSKALNSTMDKAQHEVRAREYPRVFEKRNKALPRALTTIPNRLRATKRRLEVKMVAVRDNRTGRVAGEGFIKRQMENKRKVAKGSAIAIPITGKGLRRLKGGSIPKGKKPRNLKNAVRINDVLYERQKTRGLVARYNLKPRANQSSAGPFRYNETARDIAIRNFVPIWQITLRRAVLSSRNRHAKRTATGRLRLVGPGPGVIPG